MRGTIRSPAAILTALGVLLAALAGLRGAQPPAARLPGRDLLDDFLARQVREMSGGCLTRLPPREAWDAERERLRGELREMLGLRPRPERGDLRATVTGTVVREDLGFAVEKLHFQSLPGLYVTANLYRPIRIEEKLPAILYLCGHGRVAVDGVSMGNKSHYQHHGAWFARSGYVCLIIDTLQLGEIEGKHHGTYRLGMWWWVSRGYSPAGVEAWNSTRALDYLETRPEVDAKRIGVTGRSGGGIGSWWIAALDDRPAAVVPVAGITDLENHILTGCIDGHCDCNYPVNLYRWDTPSLAALAAPKPLLFSNTDKDTIFPLDGVMRVHAKMREVYRLLGAADRLGLCIVEGPHADTQELQVPAFRWMDRWLRGKPNNPVALLAEKLFDPRELKVFSEIPADERNTTIEESFVPAAPMPEPPRTLAAFEEMREGFLARLKETPFRNAPAPDGPLEIEELADRSRDGLRLRGWRFLSEEPFRLDLWVLTASGTERPARTVLRVADEEGTKAWTRALAGPFAAELDLDASLADPAGLEALRREVARGETAIATFAPRGIGPTRWAGDEKLENQLRRRLYVVGRPLHETRILDVRRSIRALQSIPELAGSRIAVEAQGEMAQVALYAAIFEPGVAELGLDSLAASHRDGIALLGVLRVLDIPQALSLVFPRQVRLRVPSEEPFAWALRVASLFPPPQGPPLRIELAGASPAPAAETSALERDDAARETARRPNVILVMTDDQGYGDVGVHGNPVIRTQNMDRLATEGVRFQSFYVMPVCAPTRACLLTGRSNYRTRVLDTYLGRATMDPGEITLAEILAEAGYRTGIFGKWHLGDNYPMRPGDQGFHESLVHRGGGIGQPSDPPGGTSYFDPVLLENGRLTRKVGYVTDVITDAAISFIERNRDRPFFCYLATNAPHTPLEVPESYLAMYRDRDLGPDRFPKAGHPVPRFDEKLQETTARVYGMVTNIDDNLGRLLRKLELLGLERNTLLIFLTDNGPQQPRYVAGMLERKGSVHEGGIRVPSFWRWPGRLEAGRVVDRIAAAVDVVPTICDALDIPLPAGRRIDGVSLWPLLEGKTEDWPDRTLFFQWHRGDEAELWRAFAVRTQRYKLVQPRGTGEGTFRGEPAFRLYDMEADPLEEHDIAEAHPELVARLKSAYESWFLEVTRERGFDPPRIVIDGVHEDPTVLTRQDWRGPEAGWAPRDLGYWEVRVGGEPRRSHVRLRFENPQGSAKAVFELGSLTLEKEIPEGAETVAFDAVELPLGEGRVQARIEDAQGGYGVHQVEIGVRSEPADRAAGERIRGDELRR